MKGATFDKSRNLPLYARIGEAGVPRILTFLNADRTPRDISGKGWRLPVKYRAGQRTIFTLTEGAGLTVKGTYSNQLKIEITAAQATQDNDTLFYTLYSSVEDHTWLNGFFRFHNGEFDGLEDETTEVIIYENGEEVIIIIDGEQSISVSTQTTTATLTPDGLYDAFELTAQASALTIANPSTDYANFDGFMIRIKDNGTARALTFGNKYRAQGEALPTTTTINKVMVIVCIYDSASDKYDTRFSEEI